MTKKKEKVNYPAHRAGHLKKPDEGDCIPLPPAPHSSPSTGRGILREGFIKKAYNKSVSLYPLKPEEALAAFMKVKPKKANRKRKSSR